MSIPSKFRHHNCLYCGRPLTIQTGHRRQNQRQFCTGPCEVAWRQQARNRNSRAAGPGFHMKSN